MGEGGSSASETSGKPATGEEPASGAEPEKPEVAKSAEPSSHVESPDAPENADDLDDHWDAEPTAKPESASDEEKSPEPPPPPSSDPALAPPLPSQRPSPFAEVLARLPPPLRTKRAALIAGAAALAILGLVFYALGAKSRGSANATDAANAANGNGAALADANLLAATMDAGLADATADGAMAVIDAGPPPPPAYRVRALKDDKSLEVIEGHIGKRPFSAAMTHVPIARPELTRIMKAFDGVHSFDRCQPKDSFVLVKKRDGGRVVAFEYWATPEELFQATEEDGALKGKKVLLRVEQRPRTASFVVKDDFKKSLAEAGFADDIVELAGEALEGHLEVSDVRPGARVRIAATEEFIEGERARTSELAAMELEPEHADGPPLRVYHYERAHDPSAEHVRAKDKHAGFYDAKGQRPFRGGYRSPVPFARITSRFNPHRLHPVLHVVMPHNGIDFAAQTGTPVYAAAAGSVKFAGDSGPCGNMVQIEHASGIVTAYCHLSKFAPGIHPGMHVETRQLIGYSGATGRVTGPHLHFAAKRGDVFLDPMGLRLDGVRVIPAQDRDAFQARRAELDKLLDAMPPPGGAATAHPANQAANDDGGADDDDTVMDTVDLPDAG